METINLMGHEATIRISPLQARSPLRLEDSIGVWFDLVEPAYGTSGFGIDIPLKDYTADEFAEIVRTRGEKRLKEIMWSNKAELDKRMAAEKRRKELNSIVASLGEKLGVVFTLTEK